MTVHVGSSFTFTDRLLEELDGLVVVTNGSLSGSNSYQSSLS